jgi:hypothetical protein
MHFEFSLPHVDFGRGKLPTKWKDAAGQEPWIVDKLEFTIAERTWVLRKLVKFEGSLCPVDVAAALALKAKVHFKLPRLEQACVLQVSEVGWSLQEAKVVADDICWMLHIGLGQRVTWTEVGLREGETYSVQNARSVNAPESASRGGPIRDDGEHEIRNFLEAFYPVYRADVGWWRVTADWFAIARESNIVQVAGLVASVLLDRVTLFCLKRYKFPKQIDEALKTDLTDGSPSRNAFEKQIDDFMKVAISDKWNKSGALVAKIREWNDQPPFEKKVGTVFEQFGLGAPSELTLKNRNSLAHSGELSSKTKDIGAYHDEIVEIITSLLLKMAKYQGPYFVPGAGVRQM